MATLSRFPDVSKEELNALIQKVFPEKTKIACKKIWYRKFQRLEKNKNLKYQFDSFAQRIVAIVCFIAWKFIIVYQKIVVVLLFLLQRFQLKQLECSLGISIANR